MIAWAAGVMLGFLVQAAPAPSTETPAHDAAAPTPESLLERHYAAVGRPAAGSGASGAPKRFRIREGRLSVEGRVADAPYVEITGRDGFIVTRLTDARYGSAEGSDGKRAWEFSSRGAALEDDDATTEFHRLHWFQPFAIARIASRRAVRRPGSAKTVGREFALDSSWSEAKRVEVDALAEEVLGEPCFAVEVEHRRLGEMTFYFSKQHGRIVGRRFRYSSSRVGFDSIERYSDFKLVGDLYLPFRILRRHYHRMEGKNSLIYAMTFVYSRIEDVDEVPAVQLAPPPEVRVLLDAPK